MSIFTIIKILQHCFLPGYASVMHLFRDCCLAYVLLEYKDKDVGKG